MIKRLRVRTLLFGGVLTLLFVVLIGRMYYVQVVTGDKWYQIAKQLWSASETLSAKRGTITDRDGNVLAMDTIAYNLGVNPQTLVDLEIQDEVIKELSRILDKPADKLSQSIFAKRDNGEYYVQREVRPEGWKMETEVSDQIVALRQELRDRLKKQDVGIYLFNDSKRYYPRNNLASQLVGYVDREGKPIAGVEVSMEDLLHGTDGYMKYQKDGKLVQLSSGDFDYLAPQDGKTVRLTIDSDIQRYVEDALKEIVKEYKPKSVTAIAADPNTMEILAMSNMPDYNPNKYWESDYAAYYNHSIKSLYEPGSTFKIVTLAAAVEEGLFDPEQTYLSGQIKVTGETIRDHNGGKGWGYISYLEGVKYSSNVAFVKMGYEMLGAERLRSYIDKFGFGQKTGVDLGGELAGRVSFSRPRDVAAASFGQGVSVTAIQQVAAMSVIANGGKLLKPQIVKEVVNTETNHVTPREPELVRQVISPQTAKEVGEYLEQVVSDKVKGTGRNAYIEGYRVAGKTGTGEKFINGSYSKTKFLVSFIGYAPVDDPKIVLYIAVDEPISKTGNVGGGAVAAPAFKEVVTKTLRKMGVEPERTEEQLATEQKNKELFTTVPELVNQSVLQARAELRSRSINAEVLGNGGTVLHQIPAGESVMLSSQRVFLITELGEHTSLPDLTGLSLRDAVDVATAIGYKVVSGGEGYVVAQKEEKIQGEQGVRLALLPLGQEPEPEAEPDEDQEAAEGGTEGSGEGAPDSENTSNETQAE